MPGSGWVSVYRKIKNNILWQDKPFSKGQAWIDLLLEVNHKKNKILFDNKVIEIEAGEKITSLRKLGESWGWSRTKVKNFLELLQNENMISYSSDNKKTVIKVLNYNDYQQSENKGNDTGVTQKRQSSDSEVTQKNTNNNDNNDNNDNKIYSPAKQDNLAGKIPYSEIIEYLNMRTGSQYRPSTKKTKALIKARWNEGFRLQDFKDVIDKKCVEWIGDKKMEKYLRPLTLFGPKFENYLNQLSVTNETIDELDQTTAKLYQKYKEEEDEKE